MASSVTQFQYKGAFVDLIKSDKGFQSQLAETMRDVDVLKSKLKYAGTTFGNVSTGSNVVFHEISDLEPDYEIDTSIGNVFYISLNTTSSVKSNISIKSISDYSIIQKFEVYIYQKSGNSDVTLPTNIFGQETDDLKIAKTKGFLTKLSLFTFDAGEHYLLENGGSWKVDFDDLTSSFIKPKQTVKVVFTVLDSPNTYYGLSKIKLFDKTINDYISLNGSYYGTKDLAFAVLENKQSLSKIPDAMNQTAYSELKLSENQIKSKIYTNIDSVGEIIGSFTEIQDTANNWCSKAKLERKPTLVVILNTNHIINKVKFNNTIKNTETSQYYASKVQVQVYYDNVLMKSQIFTLGLDTDSEMEIVQSSEIR